ncbi:MAG: glycosyltransferase [Sphingomonas sp.]|nr:glycosyltransferase [Sphingomonas sp.]
MGAPLTAAYRTIRRRFGAMLRELRLYARMLSQSGEPRLLAMLSDDEKIGATYLRATSIAEELSRRGWKTAVCPVHLSLRQRKRVVRLFRPDVILIQMNRHPLNVPQHFRPVPCVFDIDDADFQTGEQLPRVLDNMRGCTRIIAGSNYIADWCRQHNDAVDVVWTATPVLDAPSRPQAERGPIVSWAASGPTGYPLEADFTIEVMALVAKARSDVRFRLYADDGSPPYQALVDRFRARGVPTETLPTMGYDRFLASLEEVAVGLNPLVNVEGFSAGKSFGKLLGYLHARVPSISHPNGEHPHFFETGRNGYLAETPEQWARIILDLLDDAPLRQRIADAAHDDLLNRLSLRAGTDQVDAILRRAIAEGPRLP